MASLVCLLVCIYGNFLAIPSRYAKYWDTVKNQKLQPSSNITVARKTLLISTK